MSDSTTSAARVVRRNPPILSSSPDTGSASSPLSSASSSSSSFKIRIRKRGANPTPPASPSLAPASSHHSTAGVADDDNTRNCQHSDSGSSGNRSIGKSNVGAAGDRNTNDDINNNNNNNNSNSNSVSAMHSLPPLSSSPLVATAAASQQIVTIRRRSSVKSPTSTLSSSSSSSSSSPGIEEAIKEHVVHQHQLKNVREQHQETATMLVRKLSLIKRKQMEERFSKSNGSSPATTPTSTTPTTDGQTFPFDRRKSGQGGSVMDFLKKLPSAESNYRREEEERKRKSRASAGNNMADILKNLPSAESNFLREEQERKHRSRTSCSSDSSDTVSPMHSARGTLKSSMSSLKQHLALVDLPDTVLPLSREEIEELYGVIEDDDNDEDGNDTEQNDSVRKSRLGDDEEDEDDEEELVTDEIVTRFEKYIKNPFFNEALAVEPVILMSEEECHRMNEMIRIVNNEFGGDLKNYRILAIIEARLLKQAQMSRLSAKRLSRPKDALFGKLFPMGRNSNSFRLGRAGSNADRLPGPLASDVNNHFDNRRATEIREHDEDEDMFKFRPQYSIVKCSRGWKSQLKSLRENSANSSGSCGNNNGNSGNLNRYYVHVPYEYEWSRAMHMYRALQTEKTC